MSPSFFVQKATVPNATAWVDQGALVGTAGTPGADELGSHFGVGFYRWWRTDIASIEGVEEIQIVTTVYRIVSSTST